jgi:1-deoxy-D-xylulose-5-phosphate reductoisomerase
MMCPGNSIAVLGSTGSIGRNALEVIGCSQGRFSAVALSAHSKVQLLREQALKFHPRWIVATDPEVARKCDWSALHGKTELLTGPGGIAKVVTSPEVQTVLTAIVGSAGLEGTWAAVEAGKTVALANKETLVVAGPLIMELARQRNAQILPVDSEHSAIFQAMQAGKRAEVRRVILTASGGPFRRHTKAQLAQVTVAEALHHPTWDMGRKITVDSATMMNKALEIIEARWLFDLEPDQIEVMVHPQSIVHSMVEFVDGSVIAQMSPPDMKLPIQVAFSWPERFEGTAARIDWRCPMQLDFEPPDGERFPALQLGLEVARAGGTAGAVVNGANEAAVAAFLDGALGFDRIVPACCAVLQNHNFDPTPSLADLLAQDRWAREEVVRWMHV